MYMICIACTHDLLPIIVACNTNAVHVLMSEREPSVLWLRPCKDVYPGKVMTSVAIVSYAMSRQDLSILLHCMACKFGLAACTWPN